MTGAPTDMIIHDDIANKENLWKEIMAADKRQYVIATSVSSDKQHKTQESIKTMGLVDSHAYSLISTHIVQKNGTAIGVITPQYGLLKSKLKSISVLRMTACSLSDLRTTFSSSISQPYADIKMGEIFQ